MCIYLCVPGSKTSKCVLSPFVLNCKVFISSHSTYYLMKSDEEERLGKPTIELTCSDGYLVHLSRMCLVTCGPWRLFVSTSAPRAFPVDWSKHRNKPL